MTKQYHLFDGVGLELEYMIVTKDTCKVSSIADYVLNELSPDGKPVENEVVLGDVGVSNELAMHVIEIKSMLPVKDFESILNSFNDVLKKINLILSRKDCMLMSGGTHPFMNPQTEGRRWPYGNQEIYDTYHRIFNTHGHGWFNLQSVHLNFPFCGEEEFVVLHEAIRILLPVIPALCASSPVMDSLVAENHCQRLAVYEKNQAIIPEISGKVIPESINSIREYEDKILAPMYRAIQSHDHDRLLQEEWLNSRGAIARFDRNAIEIRVCDIQEHCAMDLTIAKWVELVLGLLVEKFKKQKESMFCFPQDALVQIYKGIVKSGMKYTLPPDYAELFGFQGECSVKKLICFLNEYITYPEFFKSRLNLILEQGSLATRMLTFLNSDLSPEKLNALCLKLSDCVVTGKPFEAGN